MGISLRKKRVSKQAKKTLLPFLEGRKQTTKHTEATLIIEERKLGELSSVTFKQT